MVGIEVRYFMRRKDQSMAYREPPENDHDVLMALWYAIVGTNGEGVMERVKRLEERPRARWLVIKDLLVSGGIIAIILEKVLG
jgi:Uri superfamily endonuclease